ncbi:MAG: DNA topoisomerase I [Candidatus Micrarchaeaceae archaeon]
MKIVIIAEKPSVASKIARAAGEGKLEYRALEGVRYYEIDGKDNIYVLPAAGHLFTLKQKKKESKLPIFDIEWEASFKVDKKAHYTKKYLDVMERIGASSDIFVNACDYDIEGTVIGTNIIKFLQHGDVNKEIDKEKTRRMKFSTTTITDLKKAFESLNPFDEFNFYAGETRHIMDWLWGINLSRALMNSIFIYGKRKVMSIGRVQGPTLAMLAKRENEIKSFVPEPYWKVYLVAKNVRFDNEKGKFEKKEEAERALEASKSSKVVVERTEEKDMTLLPMPPFDLTSLQLEASRVFGIDPSRTLAIAQRLYEESYISYPRTSSQKLPYSLNLPRIIELLSKMKEYYEIANRIILEKRFKPREGKKEDEAHPAIYPTGEEPKGLTEEEKQIYDLIARRFLSCFYPGATINRKSVWVRAGEEIYSAAGAKVKDQGWLSAYKFYSVKETDLSMFKTGEQLNGEFFIEELKTEPPKRYTKASLIAVLEKKGLGTKATRAGIIDTLFQRGYIKGHNIEVTEFGMKVYETLKRYSEKILDEKLTRELERDMDFVMKGKMEESEVIEKGKKLIKEIIQDFEKNESKIGKDLSQGLKESEKKQSIGKCPKCGGDLVLRKSKKGSMFVGCSNWPECSNTYPLPHNSLIKPTGKVCPLCKTPIVKVFRKGKKVFEMDLDPSCSSKKEWAKDGK